MKSLASLVLAGSFMALSGCAATSRYMVKGTEYAPVTPEVAQVVFVRPSGFARAIAATIVDSQGRFIGDSIPNSRFAVNFAPGEYTFIAWGEGTHSLKASLAAGKTYYIEVAPVMGVWAARFHLKALKPGGKNWDQLQDWLRESTPHTVQTAEGQQYVDGRREDAQDAITKGVARFAEYTPEEAAERTLAPSDGV